MKFARGFASQPGYQPTPADIDEVRAHRTQVQGAGGSSGDPMLMRAKDNAMMVDYWDKVETIIDGIDGFRAAGTKYLPRFIDEAGNEYNFRLKLTKVTNVFRDIVDSLSAKPFQEECTLVADENTVIPPDLEEFIEDVDGASNNLTTFASNIFFNGIANAIHWIFVDFSQSDGTIRTKADEKAAGIRPYWSHVLARNVLDARVTIINGKETLTFIKIYEPGDPDHVRIFQRDGAGNVTWSVYVKTDIKDPLTQSQFVLESEGAVTIDVIPLVPFMTGRRDGRTFRLFPSLKDAADLQIDLYQNESALKFAKTLTGYPMLSASGVKPAMMADGTTVKRVAIGPNRVLYAPPVNGGTGRPGRWEYIEPSAESLKFLAEDIKHTIEQLRELGKQPLTSQAGLTVISTSVAAGKSNSAVKTWALGLKDALENAMVVTCLWLNITQDQFQPSVSVFTEFDDFTDGKDVEALQGMRYPSNGAQADISQETYWEEMRRRGILSPEFDAETEEARLLEELPGDGQDTGLNDDPPSNPGDPANPPAPMDPEAE